jgi:hypothetical protein
LFGVFTLFPLKLNLLTLVAESEVDSCLQSSLDGASGETPVIVVSVCMVEVLDPDRLLGTESNA